MVTTMTIPIEPCTIGLDTLDWLGFVGDAELNFSNFCALHERLDDETVSRAFVHTDNLMPTSSTHSAPCPPSGAFLPCCLNDG